MDVMSIGNWSIVCGLSNYMLMSIGNWIVLSKSIIYICVFHHHHHRSVSPWPQNLHEYTSFQGIPSTFLATAISNPTKLLANCFWGKGTFLFVRDKLPYILIHCRCTIMSMVYPTGWTLLFHTSTAFGSKL